MVHGEIPINFLVGNEKIGVAGVGVLIKRKTPMKLFGTGTRSIITNDGLYSDVLLMTIREIKLLNPSMVISGMAEGFDEAVAEAAILLEIPLWACIPNPGYEHYYWEQNSQTGENRLDHFNKLLSKASKVTRVCKYVYENGYHSNFIRNEFMVDNGDHGLVLADKNGRFRSGTAHCFKYIQKVGKPFTVIKMD